MTRFLLVVVCLAFAACDSPSTAPAVAQADQSFSMSVSANALINDIFNAPTPDAGSDMMERDAQISGIIANATTASDAWASAQTVADGASDPRVQTVLRETIAQNVLARWGAGSGAADRDALTLATALLVEHQSPEAALILDGLAAAGDQWTAERRKEAAIGTLAAIDAAGLRRCMLCESSEPQGLSVEQRAAFGANAEEMAADYARLQDQVAAHIARRDAAVRRLEQLAG